VAALGSLLFTVGCGSGNVKSEPTATYAYVLSENFSSSPNFTATLSQFKMGNDGTLSPMNPATLPVDTLQSFVAVDPTGHYLFTYGGNGGEPIHQFVIGADGTLRPNLVPSIAAGEFTVAMTFSPNGQFALAADALKCTVSSYSLGPSGLLTLISTVPSVFNPGDVSVSIAFDSTGAFAYVGGPNTIAEYTVSSNGVMNPLTTYSTNFSGALILSPDEFLYGTEGFGSEVGEFSINRSNGSLSMVNSFSYTSAVGREGWDELVFEPSGMHAYTNTLDSVSPQKVDPMTGALSTNGPAVATGNCACAPTSIALDPSGRFLFQASFTYLNQLQQPQVSQLKVNPNGTLTPNGVIPVPGQGLPAAITLVTR